MSWPDAIFQIVSVICGLMFMSIIFTGRWPWDKE